MRSAPKREERSGDKERGIGSPLLVHPLNHAITQPHNDLAKLPTEQAVRTTPDPVRLYNRAHD